MAKKKNNDIIVSFVGGSKDDVTGSCVLVQYPKKNDEKGLFAIEMGLIQGEPTIEQDISSNRKMIENISLSVIRNLEAVFLGHAHIDHIGNLPICNSENGFDGAIIGSKATIEIGKELIKDSVFIHGRNVDLLKSKGKKVKKLYTESQMYDMFDKMQCMPIGEKCKFNEYIEYKFVNSGHVLGGCMIEFWIKKPNNKVVHFVYSSDLGSSFNIKLQPFVKEMDIIQNQNFFICEGTYNNPNRSFNYKEAIKEREELKSIIKECMNNEKRLLMPTFSAFRCQQLMCLLYDWFHDDENFKSPIILDGVLLHKINNAYLRILEGEEKEYFKKVMSWDKFKFNKSYDSTIATLSKYTSGVYISSSGFMQNGRVTTYLQQFLGCSKDYIVITGYCGGENSIGYNICDETKNIVNINGITLLKRAKIFKMKTFSSHIQYEELLKLWKSINCEKIIVHHSNEGKYDLVKDAKEAIRNVDKTTNVVAVDKCANQFKI